MYLKDICKIYYGQVLSRVTALKGEDTVRMPVYSFYESDTNYIDIPYEMQKKVPKTTEGMILLNVTSHRASVIKKDDAGKIIPSTFIAMESDKANPTYLEWHINNDHYFQHQLHKSTQGSSVAAINVSQLKEIRVMIPKKVIQDKIATIIELSDKKKILVQEQQELYEKIIKHINKEGF